MSRDNDTGAERRAALSATEYQRIRSAVPQLRIAEQLADEYQGHCSGCAWEHLLKPSVTSLVGWQRSDKSDPSLCTMEAYDAVVDHLVARVDRRMRARRRAGRAARGKRGA